MKKVLVIGSSGAGKSTFARRMGEITGLEPKVAATLDESLRELLVDENPTRN